MLVLKAVNSALQSHGGFQWPNSGYVKCDDWDPTDRCGGGLHGWANGEGDYIHHEHRHWLVVEVPDETVVVITEDGGGKVKFPAGNVVYSGTQSGAVSYLINKKALTINSNPAWACFSPSQCATLAKNCSDRAAKYAAAYAAANAANAAAKYAAANAAYAANAANAAAKYAAANAANAANAAANAAYAANAANAAAKYAAANAAYAAYAANAAANAAYAANAANAAANAENEALRRDKLSLLGII